MSGHDERLSMHGLNPLDQEDHWPGMLNFQECKGLGILHAAAPYHFQSCSLAPSSSAHVVTEEERALFPGIDDFCG